MAGNASEWVFDWYDRDERGLRLRPRRAARTRRAQRSARTVTSSAAARTATPRTGCARRRGAPGRTPHARSASAARTTSNAHVAARLERMRIAHFSDLHVLALDGVPPHRFFNKRFTGWVNLRLKRAHNHRPAHVRAVAREITRAKVDHVVITGDLTNLALEQEFVAVRELLEEHLGLDAAPDLRGARQSRPLHARRDARSALHEVLPRLRGERSARALRGHPARPLPVREAARTARHHRAVERRARVRRSSPRGSSASRSSKRSRASSCIPRCRSARRSSCSITRSTTRLRG